MRKPFLLALLALAHASAAALDSDFTLRIQHAQNLLLLQGSTTEVLGEYDELISAISKAALEVPKHSFSQVYYQRSLIEISLGKLGLAIADLVEALAVDPSFQPASKKLMDVLLDRGLFQELRSRFSEYDYPELYATLDQWETGYELVVSIFGEKTRYFWLGLLP